MTWFQAAARGNVAELKRHLDNNKQKVDAKDRSGFTALRLAVENGHAGAVALLLDYEADPKRDGPAYFAIDAHRADILKLLLDAGLDPNGGLKGLGTYVEKAVQVTAGEFRGRGKTDLSARPSARPLLTLVAAGAELAKVKGLGGESPLAYAIGDQDEALVRYLVAQGMDVDGLVDSRERWTPLMWCAQHATPAVLIPLLLELGADPARTDRRGRTALELALLDRKDKAAELLRPTVKKDLAAAAEAGARKQRARWDKDVPADDEGDAIEKTPIAQRRGTINVWSYDSWIAMAIRADDLDALADAFANATTVIKIHRDVTADVLARKLPTPKTRHIVILKLKGHTWASVAASWGDLWYLKFQRQLSRDARRPVLTCGHQDTASASFVALHEKGKLRVDFESVGDYAPRSRSTHLKGDAYPPDWWRQHEDENQTIQALLREQDAYVPMFNVYDNRGTIYLEAFPEDAVKKANVERVMLVVCEGESDE
jgi:ankyrin repeat protein